LFSVSSNEFDCRAYLLAAPTSTLSPGMSLGVPSMILTLFWHGNFKIKFYLSGEVVYYDSINIAFSSITKDKNKGYDIKPFWEIVTAT